MYVKELIEKLQQCNPEAVVLMHIPNDYLVADKIVKNNDDEVPSIELYADGHTPKQYKEWRKSVELEFKKRMQRLSEEREKDRQAALNRARSIFKAA